MRYINEIRNQADLEEAILHPMTLSIIVNFFAGLTDNYRNLVEQFKRENSDSAQMVLAPLLFISVQKIGRSFIALSARHELDSSLDGWTSTLFLLLILDKNNLTKLNKLLGPNTTSK